MAAGQLRHYIQESTERELLHDANLTAWEQYQNFVCNKIDNSKVSNTNHKNTAADVKEQYEDSSNMYYDDDDTDEDDSEDSNDDDDDVIDDVIRPKMDKSSKTVKKNSTEDIDDTDDDYSYEDEDEDDEEEIKLTDKIKDVKIKEQKKIDGKNCKAKANNADYIDSF